MDEMDAMDLMDAVDGAPMSIRSIGSIRFIGAPGSALPKEKPRAGEGAGLGGTREKDGSESHPYRVTSWRP